MAMSRRFANVVYERHYQGYQGFTFPQTGEDEKHELEVKLRQDGTACLNIVTNNSMWAIELSVEQKENLADFLRSYHAVLWEDVEVK